MAMSPREFRRLVLQIERDLVAQSQLRTMLAAAGVTLRDHRQTLRDLRAGVGRSERIHTSKTDHQLPGTKSGTMQVPSAAGRVHHPHRQGGRSRKSGGERDCDETVMRQARNLGH